MDITVAVSACKNHVTIPGIPFLIGCSLGCDKLRYVFLLEPNMLVTQYTSCFANGITSIPVALQDGFQEMAAYQRMTNLPFQIFHRL